MQRPPEIDPENRGGRRNFAWGGSCPGKNCLWQGCRKPGKYPGNWNTPGKPGNFFGDHVMLTKKFNAKVLYFGINLRSNLGQNCESFASLRSAMWFILGSTSGYKFRANFLELCLALLARMFIIIISIYIMCYIIIDYILAVMLYTNQGFFSTKNIVQNNDVFA